MTASPLRLAVALLCAALPLSSCGFPAESSASPVASDELPEVFNPQSSAAVAATDEVTVWFVRSDLLVQRPREVASPAGAGAVVGALGQGVSLAEVDRGLRSAIPDASVLVGAESAGGTATVQLSSGFLEIPPGDQVLALGQVVLTLTDLRGVGRVRFEINGEAVATPLPDGTSTAAPVARDDFSEVVGG